LVIGSTVQSIGYYAFTNSPIAGTLSIPDSVINIDVQAFQYTSITTGASVAYVGVNAFQYTPITSLILGSSLTAINNLGFHGMTSLRDTLYS
jgi:hypothetical protein